MVVTDAGEALEAVASGRSVVLVVAEDSGPVGPLPPGAGRLAVMVGSGLDPAVQRAAAAMAEELFGV